MNMTNTRVILLVIVHSVIHAALAEDAVIEFNNVYTKYFDDYRCNAVNRPIIIEDKPTSIRVYFNSSMDITSGNCYYQYENIQLSKTEYSRNTFLIQDQLEFKFADNKFTCNFHTLSQIVIIKCDTILHIRTNTPVAQIYLNYTEVAATRTSLDVKEYDASALYYFKRDETVFIDCKHSQRSGFSKIMYFNNTGGKLLETGYFSSNASVLITLTQESHSNYLYCYYKNFIISSNNEKGDVTVTRILFNLRSAEIENKFASPYWTWISSGIVMIVIIIIIIIYKVRNYKKRRNEIQSSNMNLVNSSETPLPHPRLWDEANYTELKVSEIYNGLDHENIIINKGHTSKNYSDNNYATVNNNRSRIIMELNHEYTYILPVNNTKNLEEKNAENNNCLVRFTGSRTGGSNYEDTSLIQSPSQVNNHVSGEPEEHIYCEVR